MDGMCFAPTLILLLTLWMYFYGASLKLLRSFLFAVTQCSLSSSDLEI